MIILPLRIILFYFALNSAVHTASHFFPIERSKLFVILGMMRPSHASSGKAVKYSRYGFLNCMVCPFGPPTLMNGPIFVDG